MKSLQRDDKIIKKEKFRRMCCLCFIPKMKASDQFEKKNIPSDLGWRTSIKANAPAEHNGA